MGTAFENLKKNLELAIRHLKETKHTKKNFDVLELIGLESQTTDLITERVTEAEAERYRDQGSPRGQP